MWGPFLGDFSPNASPPSTSAAGTGPKGHPGDTLPALSHCSPSLWRDARCSGPCMAVSHLQHIPPSPLDMILWIFWSMWAVQDTPILHGHAREGELGHWRGRGKMGPHQLWWRSSFPWVLLCHLHHGTASDLATRLWVSCRVRCPCSCLSFLPPCSICQWGRCCLSCHPELEMEIIASLVMHGGDHASLLSPAPRAVGAAIHLVPGRA